MSFPTTSVLDDFTTDDLATNWVTPALWDSAGLAVTSGEVTTATDGSEGTGVWATPVGPDCEVYATLDGANAQRGYLYWRADSTSSTWNGYDLRLRFDIDTVRVNRVDAGVETQLGADISFPAGGGLDGVGISHSGGTITLYKRVSGVWSVVDTRTDSTYNTAGYIGVASNDVSLLFDDFGGGTVSGSGAQNLAVGEVTASGGPYGVTLSPGTATQVLGEIVQGGLPYGVTLTQTNTLSLGFARTRYADPLMPWSSTPGPVVFGPTLAPGGVAQDVSVIAQSGLPFGVTLTPGTVTLSLGAIASGDQVFGITLTETGNGLTATFETGTNGATIATSDTGSADAWDVVNGTPTYDNTHALDSLAGYFAAGTNGYLRWQGGDLGTPTEQYGRAYLYLAGDPTSDNCRLLQVNSDAGYFTIRVGNLAGNGRKLFLAYGETTLTTGSTVVPVDQWIRIEWHIAHDPTSGTWECKLFTNPDSTTPDETITFTGDTDSNSVAFLAGSIVTTLGADLWLDDIVAGAASWPGPASYPKTVTVGEAAASGGPYGVTLSPGAALLAPGFIGSSSAVYGVNLVPGTAVLGLGEVAVGGVPYGVTFAPGTAILALGEVALSGAPYGLTLENVVALDLGVITSTRQVYGPTLSPGAATLSLGTIPSASVVYGVNFMGLQILTLDFIQSGIGVAISTGNRVIVFGRQNFNIT